MNFLLFTTFFLTRFFLHLCIGGTVYFFVSRFIQISKLHFSLLLILPLAIIIEYFQYTQRVADNVNKTVLLRDLILTGTIIISFIFLYFFKTNFSDLTKVTLIIILATILFFIAFCFEQHKPSGDHYFYKHILDVLAYTLGPFIIYPLIIKYLFSGH